MFDPYHKWLGIPKDQRPPTCYQLLGISQGESDAEVIEEAAIRQTAHIRTYQIGPNAKECAQILGEISRARITLLSPARRKEYDAQLARKQQAKTDSARVTADRPLPSAVDDRFADFEDSAPPQPRSEKKKKRHRSPSIAKEGFFISKPVLYGAIGGGVGLLLVVILVVALAKRTPDRPDAAVLTKRQNDIKDKAPGIEQRADANPGQNGQPAARAEEGPGAVQPQANIGPPNPPAVAADGQVLFPPGTFAKHFLDPDGNCKLVDANEREGSLKLWLSGPRHDMTPTVQNGPRVLMDVEGDFVVQVRVRADLELARNSFRSGTLLVWHDAANYMRFDLAWGIRQGSNTGPNLDFHLFKDRERTASTAPFVNEGGTLRIERPGNALLAAWIEGGIPRDMPRQTIDWPARVKVGVGAVHTGAEPFRVAFENFKLVMSKRSGSAGAN